ncbi:MAG: hypothetical protein JNJ54_21530 [Myxococcaceae bacterium]|nr:hypothetical protein [Myxococcaceae bacterium]
MLTLGLNGAERFLTDEVSVGPTPPPPPLVEAPLISAVARIGVVGEFATLPSPGARVRLAAGVRGQTFEGMIGVRAGWPASLETVDSFPTAQARVEVWPLLGGELVGCWAPQLGRFRLRGCATFLAEGWRLRGEGTPETASGVAFLLGAGAQTGASLRLVAGFELGMDLGVRVNLRRPAARFDMVQVLSAGPVTAETGVWFGWSPDR